MVCIYLSRVNRRYISVGVRYTGRRTPTCCVVFLTGCIFVLLKTDVFSRTFHELKIITPTDVQLNFEKKKTWQTNFAASRANIWDQFRTFIRTRKAVLDKVGLSKWSFDKFTLIFDYIKNLSVFMRLKFVDRFFLKPLPKKLCPHKTDKKIFTSINLTFSKHPTQTCNSIKCHFSHEYSVKVPGL